MTVMNSVTREQAEAVLKLVETKYADCISPGYGPKLIEKWDWVGQTPWAVAWEEGPYEWAITFGGGGFNAEVYSMAVSEVGKEKARQMATVEPTPDPEGVFTEPVTSWALGIYPA